MLNIEKTLLLLFLAGLNFFTALAPILRQRYIMIHLPEQFYLVEFNLVTGSITFFFIGGP